MYSDKQEPNTLPTSYKLLCIHPPPQIKNEKKEDRRAKHKNDGFSMLKGRVKQIFF